MRIGISIGQERAENKTESWIEIVEARIEDLPPMVNVPNHLRIIIGAIVWICILIIFYFRYIMYEFLYRQYKLNELKPINILTLLDALADQVSTFCIILYGTLISINESSLEHVFGGTSYCSVLMYTIDFGRNYSFLGSLMISIFRILLIKCDQWVEYRIGKKNLFRILLFLGISFATMGVVLKATNDYEQLRRNRCHLVVRRQIMLALDEYELSLSRHSILSHWYSMALIDSAGKICTKVLELVIYIIFFHHMFKNDNRVELRRLLNPNVIKDRNRTNAITFLGQFCSFAFESCWTVIYIITLYVATRTHKLLVIRFVIRIMTSTCLPIIEVVTSKNLRKRIFKFSFYDFIFGL